MGWKRRRSVMLGGSRRDRFAGGWPRESVGRRARGSVVDHRRNHGDSGRRSRRWRRRWLGQHHVAIADAAVPESDLGHMLALRRQ